MADPDHAPSTSAGPAPVRRPNSVRRTSTIDSSWPEGRGGPMAMSGRARDVVTALDLADCSTVARGAFDIISTMGREIRAIETAPRLPDPVSLIGVRGGGQSRTAIVTQLGGMEAIGTPLHLLLDDFAGASLVAGWAWSRWTDDWAEPAGASDSARRNFPKMEGICAGFRPGATSLDDHGRPRHDIQSSARVGSLVNPDDLAGWHPLAAQEGVGMRRARWIDIWTDTEVIRIEAGFQDSSTAPHGGRDAVHEYRVSATADLEGMVLRSVTADPRILPYRECPAAAENINRLIGTPLKDFRNEVLDRFPGTLGCTHLNDVLRALADVPHLALMLESHS
jgi:hypothetical protein|tara:strand:+ start:36034 stop:37044 length:1011 start_codon:yes stop_codon:yes gene_type:complete